MTALTPHQPGGGDVSETLSELERKLRRLEQELASTGPLPATHAIGPTIPPPSRAPSEAVAPEAVPPEDTWAPYRVEPAVGLAEPGDALADDLAGPLDGLLSVREQLQRTARELEDEFARVLVRVGVEPAASEEHPGPPQDLPATPAPAAAPAPAPEELAFEGEIVLDAGPFHGIAGLCAFEQGLSQVASAESVHVTGFEGVRVLVELRLASSTALVRELRDALPVDFTVAEADADRLRVDIQPDPTAPAR